MPVIYKLTSPSNKTYIGKTKSTAENRFKQHIQSWKKLKRRNQSYKNYSPKLFYAFDKYDPILWKIEILFKTDDLNLLNQKEIEYISLYNSTQLGYNGTLGGDGGQVEKLTEEHKQNISKARKKYFETEEGRKKKEELSKRFKEKNPSYKGKPGIKHSEEVLQRMSDSMKKVHQQNPEIYHFLHNSKSEETKKKISESKKGKFLTEEHKQNISKALKGHPGYDNQKYKTFEARSKIWEITTPNQEKFVVKSLHNFCKRYNVNDANLASGKSKGFKSKKLEEAEIQKLPTNFFENTNIVKIE